MYCLGFQKFTCRLAGISASWSQLTDGSCLMDSPALKPSLAACKHPRVSGGSNLRIYRLYPASDTCGWLWGWRPAILEARMQGQPREARGQPSVPILVGSPTGHRAHGRDEVMFFFVHLYLPFRCGEVSYFTSKAYFTCKAFLKTLLHNSPKKAMQNFHF